MFRPLCAALVLAAALSLLAGQAGSARAEARNVEGRYIHRGVERRWILHIPDGIGEDERRPMIVALHGGGGRADRFARFSNLDAIAERERVFVLYPQGFERHWNDGRGTNDFEAFAQNIDDVGFLTSLVSYVDGIRVKVDRSRVYVAGISNGGMMALRLACEATDTFAAIAIVAANMPARQEPRCRPDATMPVLVMNGTHDRLVPYNGGTVRFGLQRLGSVLSTDATVRFWINRNDCADLPSTETLPDRPEDDNTETTVTRWTDCANGAAVVLYRIERGGHTWPGGAQYLPERVVGRVGRDFNAEEAIWEFFSRHSR